VPSSTTVATPGGGAATITTMNTYEYEKRKTWAVVYRCDRSE
jgi:hypothetical protein